MERGKKNDEEEEKRDGFCRSFEGIVAVLSGSHAIVIVLVEYISFVKWLRAHSSV